MAKYYGAIQISSLEDVEKFKTTVLYSTMDNKNEVLQTIDKELSEKGVTWVGMEIDYLELFWMSQDRRDLLDKGLALTIKKAEG